MPLFRIQRTEIVTTTVNLTIMADDAAIAYATASIGSLEYVTQKENVIDGNVSYSETHEVSTPVKIDSNCLSS